MRRFYISVAALMGLGLTVGGTPAMAGYCGQGPMGPVYKQNCNVPVVMIPSAPAVHDPVVVHTTQPMDHLKSIRYYGAPHVNVTRIHGLPPTVGLGDVPIGFTKGCHPTSTQYCRRPMGGKAVAAPAPQVMKMQTHIVSAKMMPPAPVIAQPLSVAPPPPPPPPPAPVVKVAGPTVVGGLPATQVVCRPPAPPAPPKINVVRPVIGVPVPVPTPLPPIGCFGSGHAPAPVLGAPQYSNPGLALAGGPSTRFSSVGY